MDNTELSNTSAPFQEIAENYEYSVTVKQKAFVDIGRAYKIKFDPTDAMIYDFLTGFVHLPRVEQWQVGGRTYYWVAYSKICDELPLIGIKDNEAIRLRLNRLIKSKILVKKTRGPKTYFAFGPNHDLIRTGKTDGIIAEETLPPIEIGDQKLPPIEIGDYPLSKKGVTPYQNRTDERANLNQSIEPYQGEDILDIKEEEREEDYRIECKKIQPYIGTDPKWSRDAFVNYWHLILYELENQVTGIGYRTWLNSLKFGRLTDGVVTVLAPTDFARDFILKKYYMVLKNVLIKWCPDLLEMKIETDKTPVPNEERQPA